LTLTDICNKISININKKGEESMKRLVTMAGCLVVAIFLASGCWATTGSMQKEIAAAKTQITNDQTKQTDEKITQVYKAIDGMNKKLSEEYAPKLNTLSTDLYNLKQEMTKMLDEKLADINKQLAALKSWQETYAIGNKDEIIKLAQDLKSAATVFKKQLESQKDGIERAIIELERLSLPTPEGTPETTPEKETPK
jgi:flagellin-specific chaperone FliS